jgi:hypothetical protein
VNYRVSLALLAFGLLLGWLLVTFCHAGPPVSPNPYTVFLPNPALTPGDVLPVNVKTVCVPGYSRTVRDVPAAVQHQVYLRYDIRVHQPGEYEVDHLISLELGGSNALANLWPQSYVTQPFNAHVKDALEAELHREVCAGTLPLAAAQQEIRGDWIKAWQAHFHRLTP